MKPTAAQLENYLVRDDASRQRAILLSVGTGAGTGLLLELFGAPFKIAAFACLIVTGVVQIAWALSEARATRKSREPAANFSLVRRAVLQSAISVASLFFLAILRIPQIEAAVVEHELKRATAGPPPYNDADKIIRSAIRNNVSVSLKSVQAAKSQVSSAYATLSPDIQRSVGATLSQLEAYEVYLVTGMKLEVAPVEIYAGSHRYTFHGPVFAHFGPTFVGQSRESTIIELAFSYAPETPAAFVYEAKNRPNDSILGHLTGLRDSNSLVNAPGLVFAADQSRNIAVFDVTVVNLSQTLDGIVWVDVIFDHCRITYGGGRLLMKSVTFRQCEFVSNGESSRAILDRIQLQGQQPVTFGFP